MKNKFIGFDNGVTGTIGLLTPTESSFIKTPAFKCQDYTKKKKNVSRVSLMEIIDFLPEWEEAETCFAMIERPMINNTRFFASISAARALEITLTALEYLNIGYEFVDSKAWRKALLPKGIVGTDELKKASHDVGIRMFPQFKELIEKHGDADGILIAEYCRRKWQNNDA